ncbi:MAG: hypothetical protein A2Z83_07370 [Omnitrophica bacterium GWA2_52_8]|nr:MAG: hypothetical protein A2Z83_07370 [Omnitrophica bacterium GWA2_52_8]
MSQPEEPRDNCLYFDISKQERDSAIRYLLGIVIKMRDESDFPSNYYTFDEDVNVYLAHLLFATSLPEYHEMADPYLSLDSSDILRWVRSTEDRTLRYFIFKVNADHILMHTSVFSDLDGKQGGRKIFRKSPKHYRELAKLYYDQASAYHRRIYRGKTGVADVLQKLSNYFESYHGLLKAVRRNYFDFVNSFRDQAFFQFMHQIKSYENESQCKTKMDEFLDIYGQWLKNRRPDLQERLKCLSEELRRLDPKFNFDLGGNNDGEKEWDNDRKCA